MINLAHLLSSLKLLTHFFYAIGVFLTRIQSILPFIYKSDSDLFTSNFYSVIPCSKPASFILFILNIHRNTSWLFSSPNLLASSNASLEII